jgi:hypothetical protein
MRVYRVEREEEVEVRVERKGEESSSWFLHFTLLDNQPHPNVLGCDASVQRGEGGGGGGGSEGGEQGGAEGGVQELAPTLNLVIDTQPHPNLQAVMRVYRGEREEEVEVKVEMREEFSSWFLHFTPPFPGMAHLAVFIGKIFI